MECVLLIGLQATGKSSFFQRRFADTHVRLNLDMLRTRHREGVFLGACLDTGQPFVVDNTNPTREERQRYIAGARAARFRVAGYFFESRIDDALRRNAARERQVPERGLRGTSARLQLPTLDEGFDTLSFVRLVEATGEFDISAWRDEV